MDKRASVADYTWIESIVFSQSIIGLRTVQSIYKNVMTGRMPSVWLADEVDFHTEGRHCDSSSPCIKGCLTK